MSYVFVDEFRIDRRALKNAGGEAPYREGGVDEAPARPGEHPSPPASTEEGK